MGEKTPKITALTAGQVAKILSAAGGRKVTEAQVDRDVAVGAPVNGDGTINLVFNRNSIWSGFLKRDFQYVADRTDDWLE